MKFPKFNFKKNNGRVKNVYAFKRGALATVFTALFIILVVLANVLLASLSENYAITLDLHKDLRNTLTEENVDYIKSIDKEINLYVLSSREDYPELVNYVSKNYFGTVDDTGYFEQTIALLDEYPKLNSKINLKYVDITGKDAQKLVDNFPSATYGDILIECTFTVDGKEVTRRKMLAFDDIYLSYDRSGYAAYGYDTYYVGGSRLEQALASAFYSVTQSKTIKLGVFKDYADDYNNFMNNIKHVLEYNNYEIVDIEGLEIKEISSDIDGLLVFDTKMDFSVETVSAIEKFLSNDGSRNKSFYYFPSDRTVDRPNINEFLEEWGIAYVKDGDKFTTIYEKEQTFSGFSKSDIFGYTSKSDYTSMTDGSSKYVIIDYPLAMERAFETSGLRAVRTVYQSDDKATLRPVDAADGWTVNNDAKTSSIAMILVASESDAMLASTSYVVGFASSNFVTSKYCDDAYSAYCKNIDVVLDVFITTAGQEAAPFSFEFKIIDNSRFSPKQSTADIIFWVCIPITFVVVVGTGIFVWIRRKHR